MQTKRLYYFTGQQYGLESMRDKRIKVARYADLNDPFDFVGVATDSPAQRLVIKKRRSVINGGQGIVCMSTSWQHPLMWGHYADSHRGVCLGFDVRASDWKKVKYQETRPRLTDFGKRSLKALTSSDWEEITLTKFKAWEYEDEYRCIVELKDPDLVSGLYFKPFDGSLILREVIVGERSDVKRERVDALCSRIGKGIVSMKARAAFPDFTVVQSKFAAGWTDSLDSMLKK